MFDYKIYNGKLNNSNVIEWLKNKCGVRIKESFIEEEFSNDLQDDLEMRFKTDKNRCQNKKHSKIKFRGPSLLPSCIF